MEKNNFGYSNCRIFALPCNTSGCVKSYNNYFLFMVSIYIDKEIGHRAQAEAICWTAESLSAA